MAFTLYKSPHNGRVPTEPYTANATVNKGDVVVRTADANFTCDPAPANPSTVLKTLGVAMNTANATETVEVAVPLPGTEWIADANANSAASAVGDIYTMTAGGQIGAGAAANAGGRVVIKAPWGAAAANKYLVTFTQGLANADY